MPYSEQFLEEARYNPIKAHQYLWNVANHNIARLAKNESNRTKRAVGYSIIGFRDEQDIAVARREVQVDELATQAFN